MVSCKLPFFAGFVDATLKSLKLFCLLARGRRAAMFEPLFFRNGLWENLGTFEAATTMRAKGFEPWCRQHSAKAVTALCIPGAGLDEPTLQGLLVTSVGSYVTKK